jgi:xanthine dehydrogenase small subunit
MSNRQIRFVHRGQVVEIADAPTTRTVLQWLREDARCTGTKEGCAEGDCGACTVLVADSAAAAFGQGEGDGAADDRLVLRPINACICLLPTLDGRALVTVEDLQPTPQAPAHPAQQAMVDCHGSQCGFCTPGFVMSLAACYERQGDTAPRPSRQALADQLAGNLCRCTGYRPILDAAEQMFDGPVRHWDSAPTRALLATLRDDPPLAYAAANPALPTASGPRVDRFDAPRDLDALAALRAAAPRAQLLAGSTDVGLWVTKQFRDLGDIVYLGRVAELHTLTEAAGWLRIGAAVPLEDAWARIARHWPPLTELWRRFAGPPVRHAGTLGGNLANGSPIGDSAPALMALGARLVLRCGPAERSVPLDAFYLDYMKNQLAPGEFVAYVEVPLPDPSRDQRLRAYKISKRFDCDISALCAGLMIELDGDTVRDARFCYGGMAATVRRAHGAEAAVRGQRWDRAAVDAAIVALAADFTPLTDLRASAAYRRLVAGNLLRRFWLETRPAGGEDAAGDAALDAAVAPAMEPVATSVWAPIDPPTRRPDRVPG